MAGISSASIVRAIGIWRAVLGGEWRIRGIVLRGMRAGLPQLKNFETDWPARQARIISRGFFTDVFHLSTAEGGLFRATGNELIC